MNEFPAIPAITSTLSETDLGRFATRQYGLGEGFQCKLFRTGINHTYMLSKGERKYVLRVYFHNWKTEQEISEELRLLELLNENGIGVSVAVPDACQKYIQPIKAPEGLRYAVLFTFGEGGKIRFLKEETCFAIGSVMARMHKAVSGKKLARLNFDQTSLLHSALEKTKVIFDEDLPEMKYLGERTASISNTFASRQFTDCPSGIAHLDIWYDNMSVKNENEITLFDFDNCGNGKLILDVSYFCKQLFHIETDKATYERKAAHFLEGYQSEKKLSAGELALIPECGAAIFIYYLGMQASRFDWSNIFLSENYLKMYVGKIAQWLDYHENRSR